MKREARNFDNLLGGNVKGLSDTQLQEHFKLYRAYVKKLNEIRERLGTVNKSTPNYMFDEYSELKRREPVAFNGTVLHEMYFENIGNGSSPPAESTKRLIARSFGSFDAWLEDTKACLMSAHGWVVLAYDYAETRLSNNLVRNEHDVGLFANTHLLLAIDAWEHAYFFDYQTRKADYVANVLAGLDWNVIESRLATLANR